MEQPKALNLNSYISLSLLPVIIGTTAWILTAINGIGNKSEITKEAVVRLSAQVENIDSGGTRGSHQQMQANTERISKLEETTGKLVPDVAQIKTDLSWIADWVKGQKKTDK